MKAINSPRIEQKEPRKSTQIKFPINDPKKKVKNSCKAYSPTHYYLGSTTI